MVEGTAARSSFHPEATSPGSARRFVRQTLERWGCDELAEVAVLLVSELATNAVLHARTTFEVALDQNPAQGTIEVAITDRSPAQPALKHYSVESGTGRGLRLVDELAESWGIDSATGEGKRVWFVLTPDSVTTGSESDDAAAEVDLSDFDLAGLLGDLGETGGSADPPGRRQAGGGGGEPSARLAPDLLVTVGAGCP
jgi:anti-sigma regulatory factor (Ser/Thr protein kinase)